MTLRTAATWGFLAVWLLGTTVAIGSLMVSHTVALPGPTRAETLLAEARAEVGSDGLFHVVPANCSCTDALVDHLVERGAQGTEVVAFVGPRRPRHMGLEAAGYRVRAVDPETVEAELGVVAAPVWVDLRADQVRYAGGYYGRPAAVNPLLVDIRERLDGGEAVPPLPIYGCAVDAALARQLDPLRLRALDTP